MGLLDILFIDLEVTINSNTIHSIGALCNDEKYKGTSIKGICDLYSKYKPKYLCGHNFITHDKRFLVETSFNPIFDSVTVIDTFFISMLLYPDKLSHKLSKPYKTEANIQNDPFGDCEATQNLLELMVDRFNAFDPNFKALLALLLNENDYFKGFFSYLSVVPEKINSYELFKGQLKCSKERLEQLLDEYPSEMGILLVYLKTNEHTSISYAVLQTFPNIVKVLKELQYNPALIDLECFAKDEFSIKEFREFEHRDSRTNLFAEKISQRNIIKAALNDESLLVILPTGGGKTFTFQMPALIKARAYKALTIVISPLQALMRNHVESFREKNQNFKVAAISGYLSPIERLNTIAEVENGIIDILYIAPEALRSNSIFNALKKRIIERFVIDEAHCFSSWGQDFRHDYKYIAKFIKDLQDSSPFQGAIPVSCFTATAKPEVLQDIRHYLKERLGLTLSDYLASANRTNLHYSAIEVSDDKEKKYETLVKEIIRIGQKPIIIYIPQNARMCRDLAQTLLQDSRIFGMGLVIEPFYARIDSEIEEGKWPESERNKSEILNDFIEDKIDIVIATTAFGMGIDKPNIQAVIHYEISDSLESYLQESGRGGRSDAIDAECIVLYTDNDFDKLFVRQNRSKIEYDEIKRILTTIKKEKRNPVILSTKQIAEKVGIDTEDSSKDYDVMIKTALLELEEAGVISRERNTTKIYATSIKNSDHSIPMEHVHEVLDPHKEILGLYDEMIRIMATIIGRSKLDPIEIDDLADYTGVNRSDVHKVLYKLAEYKLIDMKNDVSAYITHAVKKELESHFKFEGALIDFLKHLPDYQHDFNLRDVMSSEKANYISLCKKIIQSFTHLASLTKKKFKVTFKKEICRIIEKEDLARVVELIRIRQIIARTIVDALLEKQKNDKDEVEFSSTDLQQSKASKISIEAFHHILVYLHDTLKEFKLRRGRLIYYQAFTLQKNEPAKEVLPYQKQQHYNKSLKPYYERKTEAVHILEAFYKKLSQEGWQRCEKFISDYFTMEYNAFKRLYKFNGELIKLPVTENRRSQIVKELNEEQSKVFNDTTNSAIMVLAGPGSGKTKTLVHKIASLITIENHKPEHFLMLTHGRVAATEFRHRLHKLIGGLAYEVDIMTFHAYALQLIGKRVNDENRLDRVIGFATEGIEQGDIELPYKTMLMLDEYQDVNLNIYGFINALFKKMEGRKQIIAVGDDDQCINNFIGADIGYMRTFENDFNNGAAIEEENDDENVQNFARYSLLNNYRSKSNIVSFTNAFARTIPNRLKHDDLVAHDSTPGYIQIVNYPFNTSMIQNIADLAEKDPSENIAILCRTNLEVLSMYSILKAKGVNVKYLTVKEGFKLGQLVELQSFLEQWKKLSFDEASTWINERYNDSINLPLAKKVIERFADESNFENGSSDFLTTAFEAYLYDIEFEEFESTKAKVIVSTMHKAKGKEFDSVYVMVEKNFIQDAYSRRLLYVAITRAKENLYIHTQDPCFKTLERFANDVSTIDMTHEEPNSIVFTMGLGDLHLGNSDAAEGIRREKPVAGECVLIQKQRNGRNGFELIKNGWTIGVLSQPVDGTRLSKKILDKEAEGYVLDSNAEIEYVVVRVDAKTKMKTSQVLCRITMNRPH